MATLSAWQAYFAHVVGLDRKPESLFRPKQIGEKRIVLNGQVQRVRVFQSHYDWLRALGADADDARRPPQKPSRRRRLRGRAERLL